MPKRKMSKHSNSFSYKVLGFSFAYAGIGILGVFGAGIIALRNIMERKDVQDDETTILDKRIDKENE